MANERTFLAYVRTALSFIGFGFVIARFAVFIREVALVERATVPPASISAGFGVAMVCIGIVVGAFGAYRYVRERRALDEGRDERLSDAAAIATVVVVGIFGAVLAALLLRF